MLGHLILTPFMTSSTTYTSHPSAVIISLSIIIYTHSTWHVTLVAILEYMSALVQVMAWCWTGTKPLPEPMTTCSKVTATNSKTGCRLGASGFDLLAPNFSNHWCSFTPVMYRIVLTKHKGISCWCSDCFYDQAISCEDTDRPHLVFFKSEID